MRTTVTLEPDVASELERLQREHQTSFKETLNVVIRAGVAALSEAQQRRQERYTIRPVSVGTARLPSLDNIADVLELDDVRV